MFDMHSIELNLVDLDFSKQVNIRHKQINRANSQICLGVEKLQNDWIRRYTVSEFRPNLCVCICGTIDTMLNFDGDIDAKADVKCK